MSHIAVLITCHNRKPGTLRCLKKLYDQKIGIDLFLTDDGCTDGTPESVRERFPEVNIIRGDGNLFWNRGMHKAWMTASRRKDYDYYLWLNDDTDFFPHALCSLLESSEKSGNNAIICGATSSQKTGKITYGGRNAAGSLLTPTGGLLPCDHFNGNIVLIPRSVFRRIGMLDPIFTHALGDFDYGLRARKAGIEIYQAPGFLGTCEPHDSLPKWCDPDYPLRTRFKHFKGPLGGHPREQFRFEKRHFGLLRACFHFFTIHLRVLIPQIWKNKI